MKDALDSVGLADQSRVQSVKLSGGQKRKLSVAIAIIGDPKVRLLHVLIYLDISSFTLVILKFLTTTSLHNFYPFEM